MQFQECLFGGQECIVNRPSKNPERSKIIYAKQLMMVHNTISKEAILARAH